MTNLVARFQRPRPSLAVVTAVWLALTVIVFAGGSSSVRWLASDMKPLRWPVLLVLDALALLLLPARRRSVRPAPAEYAAGTLLLVALLSAGWSVLPQLTLERTVSFAAVVIAASALAAAARARPDIARLAVVGLAAGAGAVAILGWLMLPFAPGTAAQAAGSSTPWRFQGLGENPNTVALLAGVAFPLVGWLLLTATRWWQRAAWGSVALAFAGTISLSGSRGAVLAGLLGVLLLALQVTRGTVARVGAATSTVVAFAAFVLVSQVPQPLAQNVTAPPGVTTTTTTPGGPPDSGGSGSPVLPPLSSTLGVASGTTLDNELDPTLSTRRQLFGSSGRVQAWEWALGEARKRPITGYGFGTESNVFIDRLYTFYGGAPENSYIGITMQLGGVGLGLLLVLILLVAAGSFRALRSLTRPSHVGGLAAACSGVALAGAVVALVQSYAYAAGNIATITVWVCALFAADSAQTWEGDA